MRLRKVITYSICVTMLMPTAAMGGDGRFMWSSAPTPVEHLAKKLDQLERHIDQNGSIVVKTPDVWGESRLMSHRSDIENQLKARLNSFEFRVNAVQSVRDAAFLAGAISVQQQMQAPTTTTGPNNTITTGTQIQSPPALTLPAAIPDINAANTTLLPRTSFPPTNNFSRIGIEPVVELDQLHRYLQHLNELRRLNEGDDNADAPGYALNLIRIPVSVLPGRRTERGFGAEVQITVDPYISDEILPMAWRDFVINGVLEESASQVFHIAHWGPIHQIKDALAKHYSGNGDKRETPAEDQAAKLLNTRTLNSSVKTVGFRQESQFEQMPALPNSTIFGEGVAPLPQPFTQSPQVPPSNQRRILSRPPSGSKGIMNNLRSSQWEKIKPQLNGESYLQGLNYSELSDLAETLEKIPDGDELNTSILEKLSGFPSSDLSVENVRKTISRDKAKIDRELDLSLGEVFAVNPLANVNQHRLSITPSHRNSVNGSALFAVAVFMYDKLVANIKPEKEIEPQDRVSNGLTMPAVQSLLRSELEAAYEFLQQPGVEYLWAKFCTDELALAVRQHRRALPEDQLAHLQAGMSRFDELGNAQVMVDPSTGVHTLRGRFFTEIEKYFPQAKGSVTASLAWKIIVESALLNKRLNEDMKRTAVVRNCPCVNVGPLEMFGPSPSLEARNAFREYVKCRWPIHVFALDPVTQDQNIEDSFSRRREMQMMAAVAASNRMIGGQGLTRFARRMEYDLETIELNRTAVAFSHGNDTFGWKFYPRVQSPPVPSTLSTLTHDLLLGGPSRDSDLRKRKLEPGMRECTALVVMPSFVPQVMVDVKTHWFRLTGHKPFSHFMHREPGYKDTVELSREVVSMKRLANTCSADAHLYRDGEVYRLCKAVDRLSDRLPMQSHMVTVPWENELGGFTVFQDGADTLKPQLHGWYGAPGVVVSDNTRSRSSLVLLMEAEKRAASAQLDVSLVPASDNFSDIRTEKSAALKTATDNLTAARALHAAVLATQTDTTVFLTGKNFSVLNARVIAGGVDVTDTVHVINRSLLSIRIPSSVSTIKPEGYSQETVAVYLSTPHGATTRLLIPTTSPEGSSAFEEVKKTADEAKALATKLSSRMPVALQWGAKNEDIELEVDIGPCNANVQNLQFCPNAGAAIEIPVWEQYRTSPWPIPQPDGDHGIGATGEFAAYVKVPGKDQRIPVALWPLVNGNMPDGTTPTTRKLVEVILGAVGGELPCRSDDPVSVEIEGFVRFNPQQPVLKIENKVVLKLNILPMPTVTRAVAP